jgi:hypothetical protein
VQRGFVPFGDRFGHGIRGGGEPPEERMVSRQVVKTAANFSENPRPRIARQGLINRSPRAKIEKVGGREDTRLAPHPDAGKDSPVNGLSVFTHIYCQIKICVYLTKTS